MEQRSEEWFEARKGKITGSRIGAILGMNQYQTRDDVMRAMVREWHGAPSEFTGNAATDHGTALEPKAFEFYREHLLPEGAEDVEEVGFIPHPIHDFLGASPDGLLRMEPGTNWKGGLEIKCPYYAKKPYSVHDKSKQSYWAQCQLVMEVCGLSEMDFLCYINDETYLHDVVERDEKWFQSALPKLEAFYAEFQKIVASKKLSEPFLRDGDPEVDDPRLKELGELFFRISANKERLKPLEARFTTLKQELSKDYGVGTDGEVRFATQTKRGAIDWQAIADELEVEEQLRQRGKSLDDFRKKDTVSVIVEAARD